MPGFLKPRLQHGLGHRSGITAATEVFARGVTLDGDGHGDLGIIDGRETDKPRDVDNGILRADLRGAGLARDAQAGNAQEIRSKNLGGATRGAAFHAVEDGGVLAGREADGFRVLGRPVRIVNERGLGGGFAARERGDKARHFEGRDPHETLTNGHVGGIAGKPGIPRRALFPFRVGDQHAAGLVGQVDAGGLVEVEAAGLGGDEVGADLQTVGVEEDIAALGDGFAERDDAVVGRRPLSQ